jgi:hypothetical protein
MSKQQHHQSRTPSPATDAPVVMRAEHRDEPDWDKLVAVVIAMALAEAEEDRERENRA